MSNYQSRREDLFNEIFAAKSRKTEFITSALTALTWAEVYEESEELASVEAQKAIAYAILELARVTGKTSPKK